MPFYPKLSELASSRLFTDTFYGYNHNLKIADGEFYDMKNLTGDYYPVMSQRKRRGIGQVITNPLGIAVRENLVHIDGDKVYFNGLQVTKISVDPSALTKQLVSMGAYLCIFPDGKYFNTENTDDAGSMAAEFSVNTSAAPANFSICNVEGAAYDATPTEPEKPTNGQYWIDTTSGTTVLKQYSESSAMWVDIPTVYVKISCTGIGTKFNVYDGVILDGCACAETDPTLVAQAKALNDSAIIYAKDDDYIVVVGILKAGFNQTADTDLTVSRKVPVMNYVTESNNRLWGCYYGIITDENGDPKPVNELYACKLGDFKNWNCFMGVSTDSYSVSVGSDGVFTGAVTYLGYPLFFKENCIHKVYGSYPASYQIETTNCRGVQQGSSGSLQTVNETLFYKSTTDICAFDGSLPSSVSAALGDVSYKNAVAGAVGNKYYISMQDSANVWHLFVLNTAKGLWFYEDNTHALFFARFGEDLYYVDANTNKLMTVMGTVGSTEDTVSWEAETGVIGYEYPDQKYLSRFNLRMNLPVGSDCDLYIQYNDSGAWIHMAHMQGRGTDTFTLPIRPRRCDHLRIKLTGTGEVKLYSIAKILEVGSDA